jgi:hypothetical protein
MIWLRDVDICIVNSPNTGTSTYLVGQKKNQAVSATINLSDFFLHDEGMFMLHCERLNRNKCFLLLESRYKKIDLNRYELDDNWLKKFITLCTTDSEVQNKFYNQVGNYGEDSSKKALIEGLKLHYLLLSDSLKNDYPELVLADDQKAALVEKLMEYIHS